MKNSIRRGVCVVVGLLCLLTAYTQQSWTWVLFGTCFLAWGIVKVEKKDETSSQTPPKKKK